jgi:hypothetical protein
VREIVVQGPSTLFCWSNVTNYAYLSHVGSIIRGNYRAGFRERLESLKLGRALYDASQDEGLTDLEVVNGWVERLGVGDGSCGWGSRICRNRISGSEVCPLESP